MQYYTIIGATLALVSSASQPRSYVDYVSDDDRPVCMKHYEKNRLCNLFLSCFPSLWESGITGEKWCPEACDKFQNFFPRQMCKDDHWNWRNALKFDIDESSNEVCYTKNRRVGRQCINVNNFVDVSTEEVAEEVCTGGLSFIHDINRPDMVWDMRGGLNAGSDLHFWYKHGGDNQQFRFEKMSNGFFRIKTADNSYCLGVETTYGVPVLGKRNRLFTCNDEQHQQYLITVSDGKYVVASAIDENAFITTTEGVDSFMKAEGAGGQTFSMVCV